MPKQRASVGGDRPGQRCMHEEQREKQERRMGRSSRKRHASTHAESALALTFKTAADRIPRSLTRCNAPTPAAWTDVMHTTTEVYDLHAKRSSPEVTETNRVGARRVEAIGSKELCRPIYTPLPLRVWAHALLIEQTCLAACMASLRTPCVLSCCIVNDSGYPMRYDRR